MLIVTIILELFEFFRTFQIFRKFISIPQHSRKVLILNAATLYPVPHDNHNSVVHRTTMIFFVLLSIAQKLRLFSVELQLTKVEIRRVFHPTSVVLFRNGVETQYYIRIWSASIICLKFLKFRNELQHKFKKEDKKGTAIRSFGPQGIPTFTSLAICLSLSNSYTRYANSILLFSNPACVSRLQSTPFLGVSNLVSTLCIPFATD